MKWRSALSTSSSADQALQDVRAALGDDPLSLLFVFASVDHRERWGDMVSALRKAYPGARLVGCSCAGAIGGGQEVESESMLSVFAVHWTDVEVELFYLPANAVTREDPLASEGIAEDLGIDPDLRPSFVLLGDPFTTDPDVVLAAFDDHFVGLPKVGGLASGGTRAGESGLFLDDAVHTTGVVGVAMWGDVSVDVVVAQGCRAVGPALGVTECRAHVASTLDGRPALDVLEEVFSNEDPATQRLFQSSPMVGVAMNPTGSVERQGDYLIRHLLGADSERKALAINHVLNDGDVLRFHVRDAEASSQELTELMARQASAHPTDPPAGVLLLSCLGRGRGFYGVAGHDSMVVHRALGDTPIGGFFCNGEIGPVHGRTWLHGYTAVVVCFRQPDWN